MDRSSKSHPQIAEMSSGNEDWCLVDLQLKSENRASEYATEFDYRSSLVHEGGEGL